MLGPDADLHLVGTFGGRQAHAAGQFDRPARDARGRLPPERLEQRVGLGPRVAVAVGLRKSLPVLERVWLRDSDPVSLGDTNHISVYIRVCDEVAVAVGVS
jgi:hypothetical protein